MLQPLEEEKSIYERSSSKSIYLNHAVHTLRRLCDETTTTTNTTTTNTNTTTCQVLTDCMLQSLEEEKSIYERSSSKSIYLNHAVHTLRRLRDETTTTTNTTTTNTTGALSPTKKRNSVSHEAVLGGAKAYQTSYTVQRCRKNASPPSSFSGNVTQLIVIVAVIVYLQ